MPPSSSILAIPEIAGLDARSGLIRIPPDIDVPLTPRVRRIIDTADFRRLSRISQLGLVSLVYPAAHHTRFEHSLGVYRLALLVLKRLAYEKRFCDLIQPEEAELLIVAALLHDIGHWPFCHPIEDIAIAGLTTHEMAAKNYILDGEIGKVLKRYWKIDPNYVIALLNKSSVVPGTLLTSRAMLRLFISILSGPIDIDKMDYVFRDSIHAGVPYGRNFDQNRLLASLCLNQSGDGLAITDKGKTAAEMLVFARYVMFSEVYWHHSVRSATAMFQRAFFEGYNSEHNFYSFTEQEMIQFLLSSSQGDSKRLFNGLFGPRRELYKRVAQYSLQEQPELYAKYAGKPFSWLCDESAKLAKDWGTRYPILIDAPPIGREVEIKINVFFPKEKRYLPLDVVSPVVRTLAREQFDDHVKRVRIFADADDAKILKGKHINP